MCEIFCKFVAFPNKERYNITSERKLVGYVRSWLCRRSGTPWFRRVETERTGRSGFYSVQEEMRSMRNEKLRNVAIIAHVDHGKTAPQD